MDLLEINKHALNERLKTINKDGYKFLKSGGLFENRRKDYPYNGLVDINISNCSKFYMLSLNDDRVATFYFWFGQNAFEPTSLKIWANLSNFHRFALDIGSFTGLFSLAACHANPKIQTYLIEPVPKNFYRCLDNIRINSAKRNIRPLNFAISDKEDVTEIFSSTGGLDTGSSLVVKSNKEIKETNKVNVTTIDLIKEKYLKNKPIGLIKIDAELLEEQVIKGGIKTILSDTPDMIIEVQNHETLIKIDNLLGPIYTSYIINDEENSLSAKSSYLNTPNKMFNILYTTKEFIQIEELCIQANIDYIA